MIRISKEHCTACGACRQVCPQNCIKFQNDNLGFCYPVVDEKKCVQCGLCNKVCPIEKETTQPVFCEAYAARAIDEESCLKATSGGVFGVLAEYILGQHGVVYGCTYDHNFKVKHVRVESIDKLIYLNGSKYIQSNTELTYLQAKKDLEEGLLVLYTGTPCQISGLKTFLRKDYDTLFTADIICHGVPPQDYFDKYLKGLEKKIRGTVVKYDFRSKNTEGWSLSGEYKYKAKNGKIVRRKLFYFEHYFYFYFLEGSIYRNCCYSCKYANINREGDFTLGDFWGAEGLELDFSTESGCSLMLVNSKKARDLLASLKLYTKKVSVADAIKYNVQLKEPSKIPKSRSRVLDEFRRLNAREIDSNFKKKYRKQIMIAKIKYCIPLTIRRMLLKLRYKIRSE